VFNSKSFDMTQADSFCAEGTMAAVPPPFRHGDPALCGSHPLVTPY